MPPVRWCVLCRKMLNEGDPHGPHCSERVKLAEALPGCEPMGTFCSECGEPQVYSPGGPTCVNGHGGAPALDSERERDPQRSPEMALPVDGSKYTFKLPHNDYRVHVLRFGEPWVVIDQGSKAVAALVHEHAASKLTWARTPPTKPGLYAMVLPSRTSTWGTITQVSDGSYMVQYQGGGAVSYDITKPFFKVVWWCGPIELPPFPECD